MTAYLSCVRRLSALTILLLPIASALRAQSPAVHSAGDVHLSVQTDRANYRIGDSIRVRLTFHNGSSHPLRSQAHRILPLFTYECTTIAATK
jgi:hypothetical protein